MRETPPTLQQKGNRLPENSSEGREEEKGFPLNKKTV